jgi:hypothetical protein
MLLVDDTPRQRKKKWAYLFFFVFSLSLALTSLLPFLVSEMPQLPVLEEVARPVGVAGAGAGGDPVDPGAEEVDELHVRFSLCSAAVVSLYFKLVTIALLSYFRFVSVQRALACKRKKRCDLYHFTLRLITLWPLPITFSFLMLDEVPH